MKKRLLAISLISLFALSGCDFFNNLSSKQNEQNSQENAGNSDENNQNSGENQGNEQGNENLPKNGQFYGGVVRENNHVGYEFSKSKTAIAKPITGTGNIYIYAFNDFHGSVLPNDDDPGLRIFGSFLKEKSKLSNTLILDQGDSWQGSLESNYQYGSIVQDVFTYAGVSLRTVGNHDFDWGLSHLESTQNRKVDGNYIPALAANVYDYANGVNGTVQQEQYGKEYATFVLDNGIKIGVIGVIGLSQITTISSQLVDSICFTDHIAKTKELSDYLRTEKACDVIVVSAHEGTKDIYQLGLDEVSSVSHKKYADLVLSGHDHYAQHKVVNDVHYAQWGKNGRTVGFVTMKYDFTNNTLLYDQTVGNSYNTNYLNAHYSSGETQINKMMNDYLEITNPLGDEVLSTNFSGTFDDNSFARVMAEAIYNRVSKTENIDFAVCNYARAGFSGSTFTYGDLYRSFPFDNQIILMNISSQHSIDSCGHNFTYREDTTLNPEAGVGYRIAVIDYIGLHQDTERQYDYFADATNVSVFNDGDGEASIYRDILYSYLKDNPSKSFAADNYTDDNPRFLPHIEIL